MSVAENVVNHIPVHSAHDVADGVKSNTLMAAGKSAAGTVGGAAAGSAIGGIKGFTLPVIGLTAAVSASIAQIEHMTKMKRVAQFYKDELGASLGKEPKKVNGDDLDLAAKGSIVDERPGNSVIAEEVSVSRKRRNLGLFLSAFASVGTIAVLGLALPGIEGVVEGASAVVKEIAKGVVGLATYYTIKEPLHWAGDKVFGLGEQTTHERIEEIQRDRQKGKLISKEQVFSVMVAANPDVSRVIAGRYHKVYDDLGLHDKQRLAENMGKHMGAGEIADAINEGKMDVPELAYAAVGQKSGAEADDLTKKEKKGLIGRLKQKFHDAKHYDVEPEKAEAPAEEKPTLSFAERVKKQSAEGKTHLERLEQSRSEPAPTTQR